ncbi:MAG: hypothetical protein JOZ72_01760 [Alphaproteobacteria bacterium]|nr:hypothetical protein [Alphaproteobacteria bacterium]
MSVLAAVLFAVGLAALFPESAAPMLAGAENMYTVGFSASGKGWHLMGIVAGAALVASAWVLSSVFKRSR